jgi:hypothetical protein
MAGWGRHGGAGPEAGEVMLLGAVAGELTQTPLAGLGSGDAKKKSNATMTRGWCCGRLFRSRSLVYGHADDGCV